MVMRKHQRYFPLEDATGALMPYFVTLANGAVDPPAVQQGNEAVLRARYEDAKFFYNNDLKRSLAELRPSLAGITFEVSARGEERRTGDLPDAYSGDSRPKDGFRANRLGANYASRFRILTHFDLREQPYYRGL